MPSVRASCCPLPLATPSGECVNHQSSVTLLCLNYKWGLFSMIKQICHASGGNMMECLTTGGWFSLGLRPRENHPPSGKHSIMLSPLAWHICIIYHDWQNSRLLIGQLAHDMKLCCELPSIHLSESYINLSESYINLQVFLY